ncbi:hypothetical protein SAMN05216315_11233 [Nitrosospira sp. Nsp18]|nr:hypothetical protein SAMN05216315_11233 [Nitrosospira sp. Nsp18]
MIKDLPKVPNNKVTVTHLTAMPTRRLMLIFLTWRMRFVPIKRRDVKFGPVALNRWPLRPTVPDSTAVHVSAGSELR